ncbi:MAG: signal peptidase II [Deltaproteobacteria bacterium]|nr:signal peptidase II [Deltaproteobacteria bacterium]
MNTSLARIVFPAAVVLVLDQVSKLLLVRFIPLYGSVSVIEGVFNLVHTRNRGVAFGFLNSAEPGLAQVFLIAITLAAMALLISWFFRIKDREPRLIFPLALVLGGAAGNLVDRIRQGEIIDFLDFHYGAYHWPAFNLADSAISVGTFLLAVFILLQRPSSSQRNPLSPKMHRK